MAVYTVALVLSNETPITDDVAERVYGTLQDDSLVGMCNGAPFFDCDREADSFLDAVLSAIADVESVGLRAERVEPDDFVTAAEIARRSGRTRESIRQLFIGERGPGDFPAPVSDVTTRSPRWRWCEVAAWLAEQKMLPEEEVDRALVTAFVNAYLDWRRIARDPAADEVRDALRSLSERRPTETPIELGEWKAEGVFGPVLDIGSSDDLFAEWPPGALGMAGLHLRSGALLRPKGRTPELSTRFTIVR